MRAWHRLRGLDGSSQPASNDAGPRVRAGEAAVQPCAAATTATRATAIPILCRRIRTERHLSMWYASRATTPPNAGRRIEARPAHLARLLALKDAGRLCWRARVRRSTRDPGPAGSIGSIVIAEFDRSTMPAPVLDADPYFDAGVYARVEVRPFRQVFAMTASSHCPARRGRRDPRPDDSRHSPSVLRCSTTAIATPAMRREDGRGLSRAPGQPVLRRMAPLARHVRCTRRWAI